MERSGFPDCLDSRRVEQRCHRFAVKQACLLDELVKLSATPDQRRGGVEFRYRPAVQHDNPVRVDDRVDPVRDRNDGAVLEDTAAQRALDQCVCLDINRSLKTIVSNCYKQSKLLHVPSLHRAPEYYSASTEPAPEK